MIAMPSSPDSVRSLNVRVPAWTVQSVKHMALLHDTTMAAYVVEAVKDKLWRDAMLNSDLAFRAALYDLMNWKWEPDARGEP